MPRIILPSPRKFQEKYHTLVTAVKRMFLCARFSPQLPLDAVDSLLDEVYLLMNWTGVLNTIKKQPYHKTDYTYRHAVNVAIIAGLLGKWLRLEKGTVYHLMLAGLLHDIGKAHIPLDILNKPDSLNSSEMKIMKKHPVLGYTMLQPHQTVPSLVKLWILQHHERLDGSGYPCAFRGSRISYHAQLLAVADIYDAMTSQRFYREADTPFCVIAELSRKMFSKLDPQICLTFLQNLNTYLVGNSVKLNTGMDARIIYIDPFHIGSGPLLETADGDYIDLAAVKDIQIIEG